MQNRKDSDIMKFARGMLIGGILATGAWMIYTENDMVNRNKKKMMKKGRNTGKTAGKTGPAVQCDRAVQLYFRKVERTVLPYPMVHRTGWCERISA